MTRQAQARTRRDYDYRVLIDRTDATLSMRLPIRKYTAVGEPRQKFLGATGGGSRSVENAST